MSEHYRLSRPALLWQFIAIVSVVVPHFSHLPLWVFVAVIGTIGWRLMVHMGRWSFPSSIIRTLLSIIACGGVFLSYGGVGGINGMVALLVAGFSLKSLEIYKKRDALMIVYVAYLVATSALLFDQSIWMAAYVLIAIQLTTAALLAIYQTHNVDMGRPFRTSAVLMMQALPLMLVLFIVIPRMGPIWSVKLDVGGARTGLSEAMSPGDITNLTRSSEVAFRVEFEGEAPPQNALYWRAMTYPDYDGHRWYRDERVQRLNSTEYVETSGRPLRYTLMLEATGRSYVPALDLPVSAPGGTRLSEDMTLSRDRPINSREQFTMAAATSYQLTPHGSMLSYIRELTLPASNPRSRETAREWYARADSAEAYIGMLLTYFNLNFSYTLSPQKLSGNRVDQFLFSTQEGFCGHFAGSMVFMLRAVGIPARVVVGYQGGEWNPYEKYLLVRQYDAHAWVEAWLPDKGWMRIDPTAAVAPERIERPSEELFNEEEDFLAESALGSLLIGKDSFLADLWLQWDAVSFGWQRWVVNYHRYQTDFLSRLLGEITPFRIALALLIPFALVMVLVTLKLFWHSWNNPKDPYDVALERLSKRLEQKAGLGRSPGETIGCYCERVAEVRVDLASELREIAGYYEQMRYADAGEASIGPQLLILLRQCQAKV